MNPAIRGHQGLNYRRPLIEHPVLDQIYGRSGVLIYNMA